MDNADSDLSIRPFRGGRIFSVRADGAEAWGFSRVAYAALATYMTGMIGILEIRDAFRTPFDAARDKDARVEVMGRTFAGWQRPIGVAAVSAALFFHGLGAVLVAAVTALPVIALSTVQSVTHPFTERVRIVLGRPSRDAYNSRGATEVEAAAGPAVIAAEPIAPQPRMAAPTPGPGLARQARLVELAGKGRNVNNPAGPRSIV